ncbi:MAG: hypothetical protein JWL77_168 [Chthonomonadaceae bacterium]|nr:hypothetical protein [Chthonomonadaceae bacterium]
MTQTNTNLTSKTYRGTIDEVLSHRNEIPSGATVELKVVEETPVENTPLPDPQNEASIALLRSWIAQAPTDPKAIQEAEEDLREFKRNLNIPRKETGARIHFPEAE